MKDLLSKSLAQIVTADHRYATVFEKYRLDFCCKGKATLQQACDALDIDKEEILNELERSVVDGKPDFEPDKLTLTELADHIVTVHHAYVKNSLPQIISYAEKAKEKHGAQYPALNKILQALTALKEEVTLHMQKEEIVLFPRIKELEKFATHEHGLAKLSSTYLQAPIIVIEHEHKHTASLMTDIRILSGNYTPPPNACTTIKLLYSAMQSFEADLHQHVHLENNILFEKAIELNKSLNETIAAN